MKYMKNKKKSSTIDHTFGKSNRITELNGPNGIIDYTPAFVIPLPFKAACHVGKCRNKKQGASLFMSIDELEKHTKVDHHLEGG